MDMVIDFWAEPSYAQLLLAMQKRVHDYVVADKGTAKEALDALVVDWKKVFKDDGKIEVSVARPLVADPSPMQIPARHDRSIRAARGHAAPAWRVRVAACPTARSHGCSSARRCCCCWRSTSSR